MRWECGECGARKREAAVPEVCEECGIASGRFVPAEPDEDDELRALWIHAGLSHRAFLAPQTTR
jgi:hypothetical protein